MTATFEVRWFCEGTPPDAIQDWFHTLGGPEEESVRTDVYLHAADPALNVKLREGKAEAKRRLPGGFRARLADGVEGHAEPWRKFSFATEEEPPLSAEGRATGLWIDVEKTRYQRTLEADALAGILRKVPTPEGLEASIELTQTRLAGTPWWTICMETEGPPEALKAALEPAGRYFFKDFPAAHALPAAQSLGYAGWLLSAWHPPALSEEAPSEEAPSEEGVAGAPSPSGARE